MTRYEQASVNNKGEEHFNKGIQHYFEKKPELAIQEFKTSIELNPSNPGPYANLGFLYYDLGEMDTAYEYHRRALAIDPNQATAYYGLALVYRKWGDTANARKHWEEYIRLEPSGYYSRKAMQELKKLP